MNKILLLGLLCGNVYAGFHGLTIHSRANCLNNESITWDATAYHKVRMYATHTNLADGEHDFYSNWELTWRQAVIHWGEGNPFPDKDHKYIVHADHIIWDYITKEDHALGETFTNDCSIYDGWWDANAVDPTDDPTKPKPVIDPTILSHLHKHQ